MFFLYLYIPQLVASSRNCPQNPQNLQIKEIVKPNLNGLKLIKRLKIGGGNHTTVVTSYLNIFSLIVTVS
jgi:hypothetical protein